MNPIDTVNNPVPLVELKGVHRVFGRGESAVHALAGIDLKVEPGEFLAVMGASGSGKSTCMNLIGCLDRPTAGHYSFDGIDVGALSADQLALLRRHRIGFVFQGFNLLPRTTALENVELPLVYQRVGSAERHRRALETLNSLGLLHRAHHTPAELSGGQQQRVAIARALVTQPVLLVADEPTGNLDSSTSQEIMELLTGLNREQGITIVMVTHEEDMAAFASRIVVFVDGRITRDELREGGTSCSGTPS
ncbi:MAG: ABC transporter ATP-binding protein [Myxococcota bacterium]|jgi:putative ABC transport system ATP-binding protein|nr:ABC transporter ATP-binding protein [Myxococcota bacterium]